MGNLCIWVVPLEVVRQSETIRTPHFLPGCALFVQGMNPRKCTETATFADAGPSRRAKMAEFATLPQRARKFVMRQFAAREVAYINGAT